MVNKPILISEDSNLSYYRLDSPDTSNSFAIPLRLVKTNTDIVLKAQRLSLKPLKSKSNMEPLMRRDERVPAMSKGSRRLIGYSLLPKRTKSAIKVPIMNQLTSKLKSLNSDFEDDDEEYVIVYDSKNYQQHNQISRAQITYNRRRHQQRRFDNCEINNNLEQFNSSQTTSSTSEASSNSIRKNTK